MRVAPRRWSGRVRGSHPQRGSGATTRPERAGRAPAVDAQHAAVTTLADRSILPVAVEIASVVETAAYFVVAEALANVGKHALATRIAVRIQMSDERLVVEICDDSCGGASPAEPGRTGLKRRVQALDGSLSSTRSSTSGPRSRSSSSACRQPSATRARAAIELRTRFPNPAVLVVSQYVEHTYAAELLADGRGGVGYLLKDRIMNIDEFVDAVRRVAAGGTAIDPDVVAQLFSRHRSEPLERLTEREREVRSLMAEGRSDAAIADRLVLTVGAVEKHVASILAKLRLAPSQSDHRRVLAVLTYLRGDAVGSS